MQAADEEFPPLQQPLAGGHRQKGPYAMTYGHSTRAFIEDGPVEQVAKVDAARSTARAWRALDEVHKLELVELSLKAANDCIDAFPLAL
jgi:hypothetical protein